MMSDFYFVEYMQRKRALPHLMMKSNGNIIECCNNTHQGRHILPNKRALALRTSVMAVTLLDDMCR